LLIAQQCASKEHQAVVLCCAGAFVPVLQDQHAADGRTGAAVRAAAR
jgi:hypothetical protein